MGWEFKVYTGRSEEFQDRLHNQKTTPHRCDDRVTDFCRCIVAWESVQNLKQTWRVMWDCVLSEPGLEPKEPYVLISPADLVYKDFTQQHEKQQQQQQQQQQQEQEQEQEQQNQQQQQRRLWWGR